VAVGVGAAALTVFVLLERRKQRRGETGILDLALFAIPSFRNGNIAAANVSLGEFGIIFALPLWLQNVVGYTAFQTGLILLGLAGGSFLASGLGAVIGRTRSPLFIVRLGILLEILGIAGLALVIRPDSTWAVVVPLLFVYGVGVGFATAQLTGVVLADVPVERSGQGSGTQSTARQVGSALGIAILGTVLFLSPHQPVRQRADRPRRTRRPARAARRRRRVQRRSRDPRPGREPRDRHGGHRRRVRVHRRHPAVRPRGGRLPRRRAGRERLTRARTPPRRRTGSRPPHPSEEPV
jgi:hypothetical protein